MKLLRFGPVGQEKPGLLDAAGKIRSLVGVIDDVAGPALSNASLAKLRTIEPDKLPLVDAGVRIGPCVAGVGKFMGIGLNYAEHAAEQGAKIPTEPVLFMKATSCLSGPNDNIVLPRGSAHTDWEVELGVVIGTRAKYVSEADALDYVAGYCTSNDVSERSFQKDRGGLWDKGKGCDTYGPIGQWPSLPRRPPFQLLPGPQPPPFQPPPFQPPLPGQPPPQPGPQPFQFGLPPPQGRLPHGPKACSPLKKLPLRIASFHTSLNICHCAPSSPPPVPQPWTTYVVSIDLVATG